MYTLPEVFVITILLALIFLSLWAGLWMGTKKRLSSAPDKDHLGMIQGAMLGLLSLVLGFSLAAAMDRFMDRQDALVEEASALENAYERVGLLPTSGLARRHLGEYAALRLELFHTDQTHATDDLTRRMLDRFEAARLAVYEGCQASPQFAMLGIGGMEAVGDAFARRSAFARRHLPAEMIFVLIFSSCFTMGTIGYGVGLAQRRAMGSAMALGVLVAMTLYVTIDLDRPSQGFITLDGSALESAVRRLTSPETSQTPKGP